LGQDIEGVCPLVRRGRKEKRNGKNACQGYFRKSPSGRRSTLHNEETKNWLTSYRKGQEGGEGEPFDALGKVNGKRNFQKKGFERGRVLKQLLVLQKDRGVLLFCGGRKRRKRGLENNYKKSRKGKNSSSGSQKLLQVWAPMLV